MLRFSRLLYPNDSPSRAAAGKDFSSTQRVVAAGEESAPLHSWAANSMVGFVSGMGLRHCRNRAQPSTLRLTAPGAPSFRRSWHLVFSFCERVGFDILPLNFLPLIHLPPVKVQSRLAGRLIIARYVSRGAQRALRNKWRVPEKKNQFRSAEGPVRGAAKR